MKTEELARLETAYTIAHNRLMCAEPEVLALVSVEDALTAIAALERTRERVESLTGGGV